MSAKKSGDSAKTGGRPKAGKEQTKRQTRATRKAAAGGVPAAAATVKRAELYKAIYAEWRRGRDIPSLNAKFGLSERRISEILDELRAGEIETLGLSEPWRGQRFSDEELIRRIAVISDAAEIQERARENGNAAVELGALKVRVKGITELAILLEETGRSGRPRDLKFEGVVAEFWTLAGQVFDDYGVPEDVAVGVERALGFEAHHVPREPVADGTLPPDHWLENRTELAAKVREAMERIRRDDSETDLRRQTEDRHMEEVQKLQRRAAEAEGRQRAAEIRESEARQQQQNSYGAWPEGSAA
jgi:hypothetical protein